MANRIALVTGSSRGMGRNIALKLADTAAGVAVHYHKDKKAAEDVAAEIQSKQKKSAAFQADLTVEEEVSLLIKNVTRDMGAIDILVNNFGPILVKPWEKVTAEEWEGIFRANVESAFFCMKAVLPGMREGKWGRIINIGYSRAEQLTAFPTIVPYAVAKTGLLILTRTVSASEAANGITVNMVSPGLIEGGVLPKDKIIPSRRIGEYKDVSSAVVFLVSRESGYITGTNLIVAGGWKL
jgi:3-oxoacyl-[acyl-carrier protein] reductase